MGIISCILAFLSPKRKSRRFSTTFTSGSTKKISSYFFVIERYFINKNVWRNYFNSKTTSMLTVSAILFNDIQVKENLL